MISLNPFWIVVDISNYIDIIVVEVKILLFNKFLVVYKKKELFKTKDGEIK